MANGSGQTSGSPSWQAVVVALALLVFVAAITIVAIFNYVLDDALKIWSSLSAFTGLILGAVATYFFTSGATRSAEQRASTAEASANDHKARAADAQARADVLHGGLTALAGQLAPDAWNTFLGDKPALKNVLTP